MADADRIKARLTGDLNPDEWDLPQAQADAVGHLQVVRSRFDDQKHVKDAKLLGVVGRLLRRSRVRAFSKEISNVRGTGGPHSSYSPT